MSDASHVEGHFTGREIVPELVYSRKLMTFFNAFPRMIHEALSRNEQALWDLYRVLTGEESYASLRKKKLSRVDVLWSVVERFMCFYERKRLLDPKARETLFQHLVRLIVGPILQRI